MSWLRDKCQVSFGGTTAIARETLNLYQGIRKCCSEDDTLTKQTNKQINDFDFAMSNVMNCQVVHS